MIKNKNVNFMMLADYYKHTHHLQNPSGTRNKGSYAESRGVDASVLNKDAKVKFIGVQPLLMEYYEGTVITQEDINEAEYLINQGFGAKYFNREGWEYIVKNHAGRLPLLIRALPEGSEVDPLVPLLDIEVTDTHADLAWLSSFVEDTLLRGIWYPTTVCTLSNEIKKMIKKFCDQSGCDLSPFHLVDFGARGVSSHESAELGGMAHLVNFLGTDTIEGVCAAMRYYNAPVCGFSVLASEHSTTTIHGRHGEKAAFEKIIRAAKDDAIVSLVDDSYDDKHAVKHILGVELKELILGRAGKVVIRPDSSKTTPADKALETLEWLGEAFGYTVNKAGYKVLNPKVGVLYGDGMNYWSVKELFQLITDNGWAACNVFVGMGGKLLQGVTRDTLKFALKCCFAEISGQEVEVYKDPVTDSGKKSKRGRVSVIKDENGEFQYCPQKDLNGRKDWLKPKFKDGRILHYEAWEDVAAKW